MNKNIEKFITIADFLSEVLGPNTEIVLHNLTNYEKSIVHIINGHISNRKIGDSITDLVLEFIENESKGNQQYVCNYNSKNINGKLLYSSTYFIRDENNTIVGALCLNSDYEKVEKSLSFLSSLLPNYVEKKSLKTDIKENLTSNLKELTLNKIDTIINQFEVPANRMTTKEKTEVIQTLNSSGIFNTRGAVQKVAQRLNMSEPSIYRYINKIKKNKTT
ncbi:YheO-like PAS domain protein [Malaciobacter mytili LMG 24559]|uniref:YheO-like PAS domain protein n=1 Tax=Malaciobacter mytili LMG 24559 TaxID=1032238 RepID=A0AAX2AHN9_9BACT|nr:helix-turn-helix transcriptional regulator [Malaciobacter mytili]AXH14294.1 PAS domain-containing transcriptional regulator, YheO family [Malaciobacter mytili LMG 24559]RXK16517.1 YheO-like PAS domain protein [Malaciobacter mytili LMG 24559]